MYRQTSVTAYFSSKPLLFAFTWQLAVYCRVFGIQDTVRDASHWFWMSPGHVRISAVSGRTVRYMKTITNPAAFRPLGYERVICHCRYTLSHPRGRFVQSVITNWQLFSRTWIKGLNVTERRHAPPPNRPQIVIFELLNRDWNLLNLAIDA